MKRALIFPGLNGSESAGLAALAKTYGAVGKVFGEVDEALGSTLRKLMFAGAKEELFRPSNALPALLATSMAIIRVLESQTDLWDNVDCVAGHSFGEYSAFCAAGSFDFKDALRLVREIGCIVEKDQTLAAGAMVSVLGIKGIDNKFQEVAEEAARRTGKHCVVANYNAPNSVVFSGDQAAVAEIKNVVQGRGWKFMPVPHKSPAHSPLMESVVEYVREAIESTSVSLPRVPWISTGPVEAVTDPSHIRQRLVEHVTGTVHWHQTIAYMVRERGVDQFFECGDGGVLTRLHARIDQTTEAFLLGTPEGVQRFLTPNSARVREPLVA